MMTIYTARVSYGGADRFDITRKSGGPVGTLFAPTWRLLDTYLRKRRAGSINEADWTAYAAQYTAQMRDSYKAHRAAWGELLAHESVTLVCYCADPRMCHRTVLAGILVKLGAEYGGERDVKSGVCGWCHSAADKQCSFDCTAPR